MLKNPDGSPYKLVNFNKLIATQEKIEPENVIKHNFDWQEKNLGEVNKKAPVIKYKQPDPPLPDISIIKIKPEPEAKPEVKPEAKPEVKPEAKPEVKPDLSEFNPVLIHCLPWGTTEKKDFYGDLIIREEYLPKFSFEAIVFKDDVQIVFWTNATKINLESIIYPSKYINDGSPYASYNWWKVTEVTEKNGGYLIKGSPSELKPDFT